MDPLVSDIGATPQVFVDDALLAASVGLARRMHPLTKVSATPVLQWSEPWEGRCVAPASVHFDAPSGLWRMWYNSYGERAVATPQTRKGTLHLAVSPDGVHWEKRPLGLCAIAEIGRAHV